MVHEKRLIKNNLNTKMWMGLHEVDKEKGNALGLPVRKANYP